MSFVVRLLNRARGAVGRRLSLRGRLLVLDRKSVV